MLLLKVSELYGYPLNMANVRCVATNRADIDHSISEFYKRSTVGNPVKTDMRRSHNCYRLIGMSISAM